MARFVIFMLLIIYPLCNCKVEITPMLEMFDAMQLMMTGDDFDRDYYEELVNCMDLIDVSIKPSQDGAWQGIIDYWDSRGTLDDYWGQNVLVYIENNVTSTEIRGMTIYEPCGYASNIAYYHPVTEICLRYTKGSPFSMPLKFVKSIVSGFSQLAVGSSFMHGSHTGLGGQQDTSTLAALSYQLHQASLEPLERSSILHDLDFNFREFTATEMIGNIDKMYSNLHVTEWETTTKNLNIPSYMLTYSAIVSTVLTLSLDPAFVDAIIVIGGAMFGVPEDIITFIDDFYLPELRNVTKNLNMNIIQKTRFIGNAAGTLLKLIYAFLWQEEVLTDNHILLLPVVNQIGINLLPKVNMFLSNIQSFEHFDQDFQNGYNIYPGDMFCNPVLPHPTWHLQSAIGLLDFVYLSDEMHKIFSRMELN